MSVPWCAFLVVSKKCSPRLYDVRTQTHGWEWLGAVVLGQHYGASCPTLAGRRASQTKPIAICCLTRQMLLHPPFSAVFCNQPPLSRPTGWPSWLGAVSERLRMSVTVHTSVGDIKMELFCEQCPKVQVSWCWFNWMVSSSGEEVWSKIFCPLDFD